MVLGSFYFQLTNNGNLLGEYINNGLDSPMTESADFVGSILADNFVGTYRSTWLENGNTESVILRIDNKGNNIFSLVWEDNNRPKFVGKGFLNNGILIGMYCDIELNERIGNII